MFTRLWYTVTLCCLNVFDSLSDKPCTYGRQMEGGLVLPLLVDVGLFSPSVSGSQVSIPCSRSCVGHYVHV